MVHRGGVGWKEGKTPPSIRCRTALALFSSISKDVLWGWGNDSLFLPHKSRACLGYPKSRSRIQFRACLHLLWSLETRVEPGLVVHSVILALGLEAEGPQVQASRARPCLNKYRNSMAPL